MSASAPAPAAPTGGSVFLVTHVVPAPQGAATHDSAEKKKHGKKLLALRTVQIVFGLTIFLFEITMTPRAGYLGTLFAVYIWAPLADVLSGSLMCSAGTSVNKCRVNPGVGLSVVAAVASAAATIIYVMDAVCVILNGVPGSWVPGSGVPGSWVPGSGVPGSWVPGSGVPGSGEPGTGYMYLGYHNNNSYPFQIYPPTVLVVLAVFSLLEFIVAICVTVLHCRSPQSPDQQLIILTNQSQEAASQTPETTPTPGAPPTYETLPLPETPPPSESGYETLKTQEYNTTIICNRLLHQAPPTQPSHASPV